MFHVISWNVWLTQYHRVGRAYDFLGHEGGKKGLDRKYDRKYRDVQRAWEVYHPELARWRNPRPRRRETNTESERKEVD